MQDKQQSPEATFGQQLRARRERLNITQSTVAMNLALFHGIKLDATAITRIEKGSRAIRLNEAVAIADVVDAPLAAMLSLAPAGEDAIRQAERERLMAVTAAGQIRGQLQQAEVLADVARARLHRLRAQQEETTDG